MGASFLFVVLYVLLDWASYVSPLLDLNVTPWNPAPALGLLFIVRHGYGSIYALFASLVASEILVRHIPGGLSVTLWLGCVLSFGYLAIAFCLKRYFPEGGLFNDRKSLLLWTSIIVFGSLANSLLFISQLLITDMLPRSEWGDAVMRFWIGDSVGIFVTMPLFWWLQSEQHRRVFFDAIFRGETAAYSVLTVLVLWIAFVPGATANFRYFYMLFLPLVWAASRQGLAGAIFCVSTLQIGMVIGGLAQDSADISLFELQMRAFLLALIGFLIGLAVDEHRRLTSELRHSLRLAAASEMAGALAHELNQPLTALVAYGSACEQLLARGTTDQQFRDVIRKIIGEAGRAAGIVARLRDFFRTGTTQLELISLPELITSVADSFRDQAAAARVVFSVGEIPSITLSADRLQIEVVLRNLLANAFDAVIETKSGEKIISLKVLVDEGSRVTIEISDNGPGLPPSLEKQVFEAFSSTKSNGLGLGLAISRAIVETHGGTLTADLDGHGIFWLTLPIEARKGLRGKNYE